MAWAQSGWQDTGARPRWERNILGTEKGRDGGKSKLGAKEGCEAAGARCILENRAEKGKEAAKESETSRVREWEDRHASAQRLHARDSSYAGGKSAEGEVGGGAETAKQKSEKGLQMPRGFPRRHCPPSLQQLSVPFLKNNKIFFFL